MNTGTKEREKSRYGAAAENNWIKRKKQRKIKIALIMLLAFAVLIAGLFINAQIFGRGDGRTGDMTSQVISAESIALPEWITEELLPINPYSRPGVRLDEITGFVVHYIGNPGTTAEDNRSYFENLALTGETSASSNFIIGIDGEIILCVPMDEVAYASNTRNNDTLSIEVCHPDASGRFTDASYKSLIKLLSWLCDTYSIDPETIIRHGDITEKDCPLYYMKNQSAWEALIDDVARF